MSSVTTGEGVIDGLKWLRIKLEKTLKNPKRMASIAKVPKDQQP